MNDDPNRVDTPRHTVLLSFLDDDRHYLATVEVTGSTKFVTDVVNWAATSFREEREGE